MAESGAEQLLAAPDAIMEPAVGANLRHFLESGGEPHLAIQLLTDGYVGLAPIASLLWRLCEDAGASAAELEELVWSQLQLRAEAAFSAKQADTLLDSETVGAMDWLEELLQLPQGRAFVGGLAAEHPSSMLLAAASRRIVELVAHEENSSAYAAYDAPTDFVRACAQLLGAALAADPRDGAASRAASEQLEGLCTASEANYAYALVFVHGLARAHPSFERLLERLECAAVARGGAAAGRLTLLVAGATRHSELLAALEGTVGAGACVAAADVLTLHASLRTTPDLARGRCLLRAPLLRCVVGALFSPVNGVPYAYRAQYVALLAHAVAVLEPAAENACVARGAGPAWDARVAALGARLSAAQRLCAENPVGVELARGCAQLLALSAECAVVSAGVVEWVRVNLTDQRLVGSRYNLTALGCLAPLLDAIAEARPRLRAAVAGALVEAFGVPASAVEDVESLTRLAVRRRLVDSMLRLVLLGEADAVLACVAQCAPSEDLGLLRHFVAELVAMAGPPYARDFLERALALLAHRRVEEALRKADAHTQRAVVDLIGVAHAACDGAIDEQCIALHDALLVKLGAG